MYADIHGLVTVLLPMFYDILPHQFFGYITNPLKITSVSGQIITLPLGKLMATTLPTELVQVPFTTWYFSLNPGPFSLKEHVLITIFAGSGSSNLYAINIITIVKAFYHRSIHLVTAYLLALSTQMLGYGWAGIFRRFLVDSSYMWWPENFVQVSLFRAFHEKEERPKGGTSRQQFFFIVFVASFAY